MHLLFAGDQATSAGAGAIAVDRGLGGGGDLRIVGQADVVIDAEVDERGASSSALVDVEIRVVADCQQQAFLTLQFAVLGEAGQIVVFGRDLAGGNIGPGAIDQVLLHGLDQILQRPGPAEHRVGQAAGEGFLQPGHEIQALQRIQAQGGKGCVQCQVGQSCAGQGAGVLADGGQSGLARRGGGGGRGGSRRESGVVVSSVRSGKAAPAKARACWLTAARAACQECGTGCAVEDPSSSAPGRMAAPGPALSTGKPQCSARVLSSPARKAARQAWRWILPLEVLGIVPLRTSTTASRARPCSSSTAPRTASSTCAKSTSPLRVTSCTRTRR